ncbi:MAG: hypothetical protein ACTSUE_04460 [Promethearchaeota archaeon]
MLLQDFFDDPKIISILIIILILIVSLDIALGVLTYFHARKRDDIPITWLIFTCLTGALGFSIYIMRVRKTLDRHVKNNVVISRISTAITILMVFIVYGAFYIQAVQLGIASIIEVWPTVSLALSLLPIFFIGAYLGASNRIGAISTFLVTAMGIYATWDMVYGDPLSFIGPGFIVVRWVIFGIVVWGGLSGLFNFFCMWFTKKNSYKERGAYASKLVRQFRKHKIAVIASAVAVGLLATVGFVSQSPALYNQVFTIQGQDYKADIAFWGKYTYNAYNASEKAELNEHNITIVFYNTPDIRNPTTRANFVVEMNTWKNNYPNVRFIAAIPGITRINNTGDDNKDFLWGGFAWDGAVEGTVKYAKEFILLAQAENLTNFIGINTDQESPSEVLRDTYGIDIEPNAERHELAVEMYDEFFNWVKANASNMFMTSTMGNAPFLDLQDGDWDLHYQEMWNVLDVNGWDELAPMIYRCGYRGEKPYGGYTQLTAGRDVSGSIEVYNDLKNLNDSLYRVDGNASRLGIYLGITNCTCYGRDIDQYEQDGTYLGKGYDELVKDALIAKHFGSRIITLFILDTVVENGYSMGGVFDTWGIDFLDDFNESINGVNSTREIKLYVNPEISSLFDFSRDLLLNLGRPAGLVLLVAIVCGISFSSIILHPSIKKKFIDALSNKKKNNTNG